MTEPREPDTNPRIRELEERLESSPGPRVYEQLAEEHRRLGRLEEASRVLEAGLAAHPEHAGARVALSRYRLESGDVDSAVELLEAVLQRDPTQMVANKLLVRSYLEQGRVERARERLDFYSLVNEEDPDLDFLAEAIEARSGSAIREPEVETVAEVGAAASEPAAAELSPSPDGEIFPGLWIGRDVGTLVRSLEEGVFGRSTGSASPAGTREISAQPEAPVESKRPFVDPETAEVAADPAAGTVTLGNLYLEQGHLQEASHAFREVLERDPDDNAAAAGLAVVAERLAGGDSSPPQPGLLERKIGAVRDYLERITG